MAFLEFHGNPYPPLRPIKKKNPNWILNILIQEAIKDIKEHARYQANISKVASESDPENINELEAALDKLQLGRSQEGALQDEGQVNIQKDGTPVW